LTEIADRTDGLDNLGASTRCSRKGLSSPV